MRNLKSILILSCLCTMAAHAGVVVVPNSSAAVAGNIDNAFPFNIGTTSMRYQQVYAASQFGASGNITQIRFRPNAAKGSAFSSTLSNIRIDLSTTTLAPDALSATFANNVGSDDTIVFNGSLSLSSSFTGPAAGPKSFDIVINLTTPFPYNPSNGNLLLDVRNFSGGFTTQFDAHNVTGDSVSRDVSNFPTGSVSDATGFLDTAGLITQFTISSPARVYVISGNRVEVFNTAGVFQFQFPYFFQFPTGIAVDSAGNIWVTDAQLNQVEKFDPSGNFLAQFTTGSGSHPYGIAIDTYGNVWVADTGTNRIEEFSPTGTFLTQVGGLGGGNGQFNHPNGIAIDGSNNIWVSDPGNNRLQKFSSAGSADLASTVNFQFAVGTYGNGNGQFKGPYGVSTDISGNVWAADAQNQRIEELNSSGSFVRNAVGPFSYASPYGVANDSAGNVWGVDYNTNQVFEFNSSGAKLLSFGTTGGGPGQLFQPTYIAVQ